MTEVKSEDEVGCKDGVRDDGEPCNICIFSRLQRNLKPGEPCEDIECPRDER